MEREQPKRPFEYARPFHTFREEIGWAKKLAWPPRVGFSPRIAQVKLTDSCQLRCPHCVAWHSKGKSMSTQEVLTVEDKLAAGHVQIADFTGGETTTRDDLPEIVAHAKKLGILSMLSTNGGVNRGYDYWHKLAEAGLFGATFSYDAVKPRDDKDVIEMASFLTQRLHIYGAVRMVVNAENLNKVYETGRLCILNNVFFNVAPVFSSDNGETSAPIDGVSPLNYEQRKELSAILRELPKVREWGRLLRTPSNYIREVLSAPRLDTWHCKNIAQHLVAIDAQGKARICGDRALSKTWSFIGDDNPLKHKAFFEDVKREAENCKGCSWYCNWGASRGQIKNGAELARILATAAVLT